MLNKKLKDCILDPKTRGAQLIPRCKSYGKLRSPRELGVFTRRSSFNLAARNSIEDIFQKEQKKKRRACKRVDRREDKVPVSKLLEKVQSLAGISKIQNSTLNHPFKDFQEEYGMWSSRFSDWNTASKFRKSNLVADASFIEYTSTRQNIIARWYKEDSVMNIPENLKTCYHRGIKEEDKDTDDSDIEKTTVRAFSDLKKGLLSYKEKNKLLVRGKSKTNKDIVLELRKKQSGSRSRDKLENNRKKEMKRQK